MTAFPKTAAMLREKLADAPVNGLSFQRKLARCQNCHGMCCYDGVFLEEGEDEVLREVAATKRDFFTGIGIDLPADPLVYENWKDVLAGLKTATKPRGFKDKIADYPAHFKDTSCVFLSPEGYCGLQMLGVAEGHHKWHYKPSACWLFPIIFDRRVDRDGGGAVIEVEDATTTFDFPDYPGFVTYTGCGKTNPDGETAQIILHDELVYLGQLIGRDLLSELASASHV